MRVLLVIILCTLCKQLPLNGADILQFSSIREVIQYETEQILNLSVSSFSKGELTDAYASRGESYLLCGEYLKAIDDFENAYQYAFFTSSENFKTFTFRALFGLAITYGILGEEDKFYAAVTALEEILYSNQCLSLRFENTTLFSNQSESIILCNNDVPIYGPDNMSIWDCIKAVENTARAARELIAFVKRPEVQFVLNRIIDELETQAMACCRAGGLWKGCIQKLANRFHTWNQKWQAFGIPPDPTWD